MQQKKRNIQNLMISSSVLLFLVIFIEFIPAKNEFVERYYSTEIYTGISIFLRALTGWIPFSVGDVLFLSVFIYCVFKVLQWMYLAFRKQITSHAFLVQVIKIIRIILAAYIVFILLWGLNYKRCGVSSQLHLDKEIYTTEQLKSLTADIVKRVNASHSDANIYTFQHQPDEAIFGSAIKSYQEASYRYLFLSYHQPCIKRSLISPVYSYFGVMGYYNPFTGEAQINTDVPRFLLPYLINHEIAHQLGYTDEDEANFIAYLVLKDSYENTFRYSAYFALFNYANKQLFLRDSLCAEVNYQALDSSVKTDEAIYLSFLGDKKGIGTQYATTFYNYYLKANNQTKGMDSYDDVVALLIAYQKRYGDL